MHPAFITRLKGLRDIASLINAGSDLPTILERVVVAVCQHTAWAMSGVMKVNLESGFSERLAHYPPDDDREDTLPKRWRLATSPALRVANTSTPLIIPDAQVSDEFPDYRADALARAYHTVVVLPVAATDADGAHMVLSVQSRDVTRVSEMDLAFLTTVAHLGAIAVEKAKRLAAERAQSERLRRMLAVNDSLLGRALAGDPLTTLLATIEALLPDPFLVIDLTTRTIHARRSPTPGTISAAAWQRFVRRKGAPMLLTLAQDTQAEDTPTPHALDFTPAGLPYRCGAVIAPMRIDDEPVGAMVLFPSGNDTLDPLLVQEARRAINVHLLRSHERGRGRIESVSGLISALLADTPPDHAALASRAEQLHIPLDQPGRLLAIVVPGTTTASRLCQALAPLTTRLWPGALAAPHGTDIAVLLPNANGRATRVAGLARRITTDLAWHGPPPTVAISEPCATPTDYPAAWRACLRLLALARAFGRTGVLTRDSFGPFADLLSTIDGSAVQDFIARTIGAADPAHPQLLATIASFIDGGCRYQACADALGIHVSTLRYRIERFQQITGSDLANPDTRFSIALALRLRQLAQADGVRAPNGDHARPDRRT